MSNLNTRNNSSGYRQYQVPSTGEWKYTHRTVAENKIGRPLNPGEHAHHINKDKTDNRYQNIVVVKENIHREIHKSPYHEQNACFNCGRTSHWANSCNGIE